MENTTSNNVVGHILRATEMFPMVTWRGRGIDYAKEISDLFGNVSVSRIEEVFRSINAFRKTQIRTGRMHPALSLSGVQGVRITPERIALEWEAVGKLVFKEPTTAPAISISYMPTSAMYGYDEWSYGEDRVETEFFGTEFPVEVHYALREAFKVKTQANDLGMPLSQEFTDKFSNLKKNMDLASAKSIYKEVDLAVKEIDKHYAALDAADENSMYAWGEYGPPQPCEPVKKELATKNNNGGRAGQVWVAYNPSLKKWGVKKYASFEACRDAILSAPPEKRKGWGPKRVEK